MSSERVMSTCFPSGFGVQRACIVLEQYHLEVECCNLPHIKWSRGSCNTLFLNHYYFKIKCMLNPNPIWKSNLHMTLSDEIHFGYLSCMNSQVTMID